MVAQGFKNLNKIGTIHTLKLTLISSSLCKGAMLTRKKLNLKHLLLGMNAQKIAGGYS